MAGTDIDGLLDSAGYGTLSLARDGEAYGLPVSFGYDGDSRLFFVFLETDPPHRKVEFAEATDTASLLVADVDGRFDWRSVVVSGSLRRVDPDTDEWDDLMATMDDNAWFSSTYTRAGNLRNVQGWALDVEDVRGLEK